ncbi:hypothetical protein KR018_010593 [Drosophila ironensis]|nr:hypothetical protein KR018_010593 [Drosophila ironensis]
MAEKVAGDKVPVTFDELQLADQENIVVLVDVESAIEACKEGLTNESVKPAIVLSLWLNKMLGAYMDESICCFNAFKDMCEWFQDMASIKNTNHTRAFYLKRTNASFMELYSSSSQLCKDFLTKGKLIGICIYICVFSKTFCSEKSDYRSVLKTLVPQAIDLHLEVLDILVRITYASKIAHSRVTALIQQMNDISLFLSARIAYLQALIKTSETMSFICKHYLRCCNAIPRKDSPMPEWLKDTVLHICDAVLNHIETVFQKDAIVIPLEKIETFLKVTHTYLEMLLDIFNSGVSQVDVIVSQTIIELLMAGTTKSGEDIGNDIPLLLAKYVNPYIMKCYELVYSLEDFQKHFLSSLLNCTQSDPEYQSLCIGFIYAASLDSSEISQNTCQALQSIFDFLFKDNKTFVRYSKYDQITDAFGAFLFLANNDFMFKYFCVGLFKKNIIASQVCSDILMVYFRLIEANMSWEQNSMESALKIWNKCNDSYAMFSQGASQWHVQRFLKYFYRMTKRETPNFTPQNFRSLATVLYSEHQTGIKLLKCLNNAYSVAPNKIEVYYKMVALLKLLVQQDKTVCSEWLLQTFECVNKFIKSKKCNAFAESYFNLLYRATSATQATILRRISSDIKCSNWHRQKFVFSCKNSSYAELRAFSMPHSIEESFQLIFEATLCHQPSGDFIQYAHCPNNFLYSCAFEKTHQCSGHSLKRKREEYPAKNILRDIHEGSVILSQSSILTFNDADWDLLSESVANLTRVLNLH